MHASVLAFTVSGVEPYRVAYDGLKEQLGDVRLIETQNQTAVLAALSGGGKNVAVAIGAESASVIDRMAPPNTILVNTVMLGSDVDRANTWRQRPRTTITIDLPPAVLLNQLKVLFPGRTRIGVIRGPMQTDAYMAAFAEAARQSGLTVETLPCDDPRELVTVFLRFKSSADFVWCPPNARLYTSATVKPLLIASLTNRLPVIAFSEQFVQAGALFGVAPDFQEVGRQTAAIVQKIVRGEAVPARLAGRRFRFFYNQRVARLLGVKASLTQPADNLTVFK